MHSITTCALIGMLLYAAWTDVACRVIPDRVCLTIAAVGALNRLLLSPTRLFESIAVAIILFIILLFLHSRHLMGGGDVKLLVAMSLGLPPAGVIYLFTVTAIAGTAVAILHLLLRCLPRPRLPHNRASILRRVYAAERWRILRRAPLPYGVAIACGGVWAVLYTPGV